MSGFPLQRQSWDRDQVTVCRTVFRFYGVELSDLFGVNAEIREITHGRILCGLR